MKLNKLKHANRGRCKFIGDKGLFRSANILQIVDVVRLHAVLAMFIDNISS